MEEISEETQMLFDRLGEDIKPDLVGQLNQFVNKIHAFELTNIDKGGYVQFIYVISQILV